jgi:hypothetical protein
MWLVQHLEIIWMLMLEDLHCMHLPVTHGGGGVGEQGISPRPRAEIVYLVVIRYGGHCGEGRRKRRKAWMG